VRVGTREYQRHRNAGARLKRFRRGKGRYGKGRYGRGRTLGGRRGQRVAVQGVRKNVRKRGRVLLGREMLAG